MNTIDTKDYTETSSSTDSTTYGLSTDTLINIYGNLTTTGTVNSAPIYWTYDYGSPVIESNPLKHLSFNIEFENDNNSLLKNNIGGIRKNKFLFFCCYVGNRIQPYELIMKMIEEKQKFFVKVKVSDVLTIKYLNLQFISIENNLNFNTECDFSLIKVKFIYDKILYENHKLSEKELRMDKLKKIIKNSE